MGNQKVNVHEFDWQIHAKSSWSNNVWSVNRKRNCWYVSSVPFWDLKGRVCRKTLYLGRSFFAEMRDPNWRFLPNLGASAGGDLTVATMPTYLDENFHWKIDWYKVIYIYIYIYTWWISRLLVKLCWWIVYLPGLITPYRPGRHPTWQRFAAVKPRLQCEDGKFGLNFCHLGCDGAEDG